jgi:hypothetical protein
MSFKEATKELSDSQQMEVRDELNNQEIEQERDHANELSQESGHGMDFSL